MSSKEPSHPASVTSAFYQLSSVAADLNAVSDALGKIVAQIDESLKKLNLGVEAWVVVSFVDGTREDPLFEIRELGYAKVSSKWGLALRISTGSADPTGESGSEEIWPFNEGPRALRLEAIAKLPDLLSKLNEEASKTAKALQAKLADAKAVADAIRSAAIDRALPVAPYYSASQRPAPAGREKSEEKQ